MVTTCKSQNRADPSPDEESAEYSVANEDAIVAQLGGMNLTPPRKVNLQTERFRTAVKFIQLQSGAVNLIDNMHVSINDGGRRSDDGKETLRSMIISLAIIHPDDRKKVRIFVFVLCA